MQVVVALCLDPTCAESGGKQRALNPPPQSLNPSATVPQWFCNGSAISKTGAEVYTILPRTQQKPDSMMLYDALVDIC